ncbi:MAG: F0F1 ATP synthase subunit B' [Paracoccaceae bacterium]|nr:F0F1 ATP synthase subunit B' [Paracoccaceae bacterium]
MATQTQDAAGQATDATPGMPQLDFSTFGNQIFWLVVTLVAIYLILSRIALPRIAEVLAERQDRISGDIAAAEELKAQALAAEEAYNQALAEARTEAQSIIAIAKAEMQVELDVAIAQADDEILAKTAVSESAIAEIRAGALESVGLVAVETASSVVAAIGGAADADVISAAVAKQMKG